MINKQRNKQSKLKSATRNETRKTLQTTNKGFELEELPQELLLAITQRNKRIMLVIIT